MPLSPEVRQHNLKNIFCPKSIAVAGVTNTRGTVPYDLLQSILYSGFKGVLFPVSPGNKQVLSIKTYKYVLDIEDPVDLAVIVFPSAVCHMALEQCGKKGIKSVIIISAGFKETGAAGREREKQLVDIAEKYEISFIGPNCLGVINADPEVQLNASFARKMPAFGSIGFLSQSGALCTAVLDYAQSKKIGFSKFVSFGNKADITEINLLYYLMNDDQTKVILLYLEEITDGRALMRAAQEIITESGKPILIIKSGRTLEGAAAAASHTGSLAGRDDICEAAFRQAGMIRCNNLEELFDLAIGFAYQPIPSDDRVALITNAGGPGVLVTDSVILNGLKMSQFSEQTTSILKKSLPNTANIKNPVDIIGDATAERYQVAIEAVLQDSGVDGIFVILTPQSMTDIETIARKMVEINRVSEKPLYASFMGHADVAGGIEILQQNRIPHYGLAESMSRVYAQLNRFRKIKMMGFPETPSFKNIYQDSVDTFLKNAISEGKSVLLEYEVSGLLREYGFPIHDGELAKSEKDAIQIAARIGYPVVMKIQSPDIYHKADVEGVRLNIRSGEETRITYKQMFDRIKEMDSNPDIHGVYITKQIPAGIETIIGIKNDPSFGPVLLFGLGGTFVEIFKDISFRVAPVSKREALEMINQTMAYKLLAGSRGQRPSDIESLIDLLEKFSMFAMNHPEIKEFEVNPLIVLNKGLGCWVADAKIIL